MKHPLSTHSASIEHPLEPGGNHEENRIKAGLEQDLSGMKAGAGRDQRMTCSAEMGEARKRDADCEKRSAFSVVR